MPHFYVNKVNQFSRYLIKDYFIALIRPSPLLSILVILVVSRNIFVGFAYSAISDQSVLCTVLPARLANKSKSNIVFPRDLLLAGEKLSSHFYPNEDVFVVITFLVLNLK